jgi:twitching motility protein PilJ
LSAAERFSKDANQIEKQLFAMLKGSKSLGIDKFKGTPVVTKLVQFADLYSVVKKNVTEILKNSSELFKVHEAASKIRSQSSILLKASENLVSNIRPHDEHVETSTVIAIGFTALSLVLMFTLSFSLVRSSRTRLIDSQDQNDKNQRAILRLLDEMTNLADGDLTTHTTVTEDITGAIADSVNYSIDALRDLVGTINKTAVQVGSAVRKTQNTTGQLAEASIAQAKEITSTSSAITKISKSMSNISEKAGDSAEVARKSVGIAHNGGETVRQTIAGMEIIREQIQETSKRIKRLGESSQEIGDIVNLITEISDQTNILALNAAIQASMAGEAGRGFAVVADEVQRLAERTGDATKQIEALVKTIQADTNEASVSMEQSTANVVKGAKLTENAGSALDRIEQVSMNLAQRILEISDSTKLQASEGVKITKSMGVIQQITRKTSEGSGQASNSIGELSSMVDVMRKSVAGFKLPGAEASKNTFIKERDKTGAPGQ